MITFLFLGVGLGLIGTLWTMVEGLYLILDRNYKYRTPFRILLKLHLDAWENQKNLQKEQKIITQQEQITKQEILIDPKAPWKY